MINWVVRNRLLTGAVALAFAILVAVGLVPWRLAKGPFHDAALRRVALAFGAPYATASGIRLALLPTPRLTMRNLQFAQADGAIRASAPDTVIFLSSASLLLGRAKPTGIAFFSPEITVRSHLGDEHGFRRAFAILARTTDALMQKSDAPTLSRLDMDQGQIHVVGPDGSSVERISTARLRLRRPGHDKPISLVVSGVRNSEEFRLSFHGSSPASLENGKATPLTFAYWTPNASLEFDGEGTIVRNVAFRGNLSGAAANAVFADAGLIRPGAFSFKSSLDFSGRGANLAELKIARGKEAFDGVASIRHDGLRWHVSGTLATEKADISSLLAPTTQWRKSDGGWNNKPMDIEALFSTNIDLRLSAEKFSIFGQAFENAAIAVFVRPNKAEFSMGESRFHKGNARVRLTAQPGSFGLDLKLAATLEKADIGAALADVMGVRRISGIGNIALNLDTSGQTSAQFVSNADGQFSANLRGGELIGIDLARLASRRDGPPQLAFAAAIGGKTPVENATIVARISNGAANPVDGYMQSGRLIGALQGSIDIAQAIHNLSGSVVQTPLDPQKAEPVPILELSVTGPLTEPRIKPVLASQNKRS